jgi:hypothetical protein
MANPAGTRPLREFHLGDKLRLGPSGVFGVWPGSASLDYEGHRPVRRASPARKIDLGMQFDRRLRRSGEHVYVGQMEFSANLSVAGTN